MAERLRNSFDRLTLPPAPEDPPFTVKKIFPDIDRSAGPPVKLLEQSLAVGRDIEQYYRGADYVKVQLPHNHAIQLLLIGDLHVGSYATATEEIRRLTAEILEQPYTYVVLMGDIIEGLKLAYYSTNIRHSLGPVNAQNILAQGLFLKPLARQKRILASVSDYFGHEYWDLTGGDNWLKEVRGLGIPLIAQRGILEICLASGHSKILKLFHMTPRKGRVDPLHGTWAAAKETDPAVDVVAAAHIHRAGVAAEVYPSGRRRLLVQIGTAKGTDPQFPDPLGQAAAMPPPSPLGQGVIFRTRRRTNPQERQMVFPTFRHGRTAHEALLLLEEAEKESLTSELVAEAREVLGKEPSVFYNPHLSRRVKGAFPEARLSKETKEKLGHEAPWQYAPQFRKIYFRVDTQLPITLVPLAGARIGSHMENKKALRKLIKGIADNPYFMTVFGRSIIDGEVCKNPARQLILDKAIEQLQPAAGSALALMLDGSLRNAAWKKDGRDWEPIAAASYLAYRLGGLRLLDNRSQIALAVGRGNNRPVVTIGLSDHLNGRGRSEKATAGLRSLYGTLDKKPGVLIGGHMPLAGVAAVPDPSNSETLWPWFIAPGWTAHSVDSMGKANTSFGGPAGLGVIILPGSEKSDYLVFGTSNWDETQYVSQALTLWVAKKKLGLSPQ